MSVKVIQGGRTLLYNIVEKSDSTGFYIKDDEGYEIKIDTPLDLDPSYKDKEFDIYYLAKKDIKESDIFEIYCRKADKRIGWIIPTIALSSSLHNYADNPHFLKYAYIGIRESIKKLNDDIFSFSVTGGYDSIPYAEIFHDTTALLIISKETLSEENSFNIDRASPSLVRYGYVKLGHLSPDGIKLCMDSPQNNRLYIEQVSEILNNEQFISEILNVSFAFEEKVIFKYFFLYQIFEMLIDDIYKNEQNKIIKSLIAEQNDSGRAKEILYTFQEVLSEKHRIKLLINKYSDSIQNLTSLKIACNTLLKSLNMEEVENFHNYFYRIRNFIFHQYRAFPKSSQSLLEDVIIETIEILPNILSSFKYPNDGKCESAERYICE